MISAPMAAQVRAVDAGNWGERVIAIVPLVGSGKTADDPIRPKYAPVLAAPTAASSRAAGLEAARVKADIDEGRIDSQREEARKKVISSFTWVISDDGKSAIVEFVAAHRLAFAELTKDPAVRSFDKKTALRQAGDRDAAKEELRRVKRDFDWEELAGGKSAN